MPIYCLSQALRGFMTPFLLNNIRAQAAASSEAFTPYKSLTPLFLSVDPNTTAEIRGRAAQPSRPARRMTGPLAPPGSLGA